jgi:cold shock protein
MMRLTGKVLWFDPTRGFGFLKGDAGGKDVFVHYSGIDGDGYRTLEAEQRVSYLIAPGREAGSTMATEVRVEGE